jgi:hypothetical protein
MHAPAGPKPGCGRIAVFLMVPVTLAVVLTQMLAWTFDPRYVLPHINQRYFWIFSTTAGKWSRDF